MGIESEARDVKSVFVIQLNYKNVTDIRRYNHISRGPTFVRDAAQRYIGLQKTRSKCRRCFTVLERYGCAGLSVQIIYNISPQYNKDRFPIARAPRPERLLRYRHSNSRGRAERFCVMTEYRERMIIYTEKTDLPEKPLTYFNLLPIIIEYILKTEMRSSRSLSLSESCRAVRGSSVNSELASESSGRTAFSAAQSGAVIPVTG